MCPAHVPRWRRYARFWRKDVRADIDDELCFHLDERTESLIGTGLAPGAARAQALAEFGDVDEITTGLRAIDDRIVRRSNWSGWVDRLRQDVSYAVRSLRRTPGVTATIVVTLALGLGVNVAMFSLLDLVFFRPPAGVVQPAGVRRVWNIKQFGREHVPTYWSGYSVPEYRAAVDAVGALAATALYRVPTPAALGQGDDLPKVNVVYASAGFFPLLGVRPALGRFYGADEDRFESPTNVAVISDAFWHSHLHGDRDAIGSKLQFGSRTFVIIGIAPARFTGVDLATTDVWMPFASIPNRSGGSLQWWTSEHWDGHQILLRPHAGVSDVALDQRLTAAFRRPELHRIPNPTTVATVGSIIQARGPEKLSDEVQIATRLAGVALLVMLIACANVLSLLIGRSLRRRREIAVRLALGISRRRLAGMMVIESLILALLSSVAAIVGAYWTGGLLRTLLLPDVHWAESPLHWRVVAFGILGAIAAGVVVGLLCAWQTGSPDITTNLKSGGREGARQGSRLRTMLVVAQAAMSIMLLVGAALFIRSLSNVHAVDIGFDTDRLLFVDIRQSQDAEAPHSTQRVTLEQFAARLRGTGGIESVALTSMRPLVGIATYSYYPDVDTTQFKKPEGVTTDVSPEYFTTTGTRLGRGPGFSGFRAGVPMPEVIINEAMARALWPGIDPIGRCIRFAPIGPCSSIVGVVKNGLVDHVVGKEWAQLYRPMAIAADSDVTASTIVLRVAPKQMSAAMNLVRTITRQTMPGRIPMMTRMTEVLEPEYRPWKLGATIFSLFAALAVLVAAIGVYSTVSFAVAERTHEFGVRIALGAQLGDVLAHVLGGGLRVVATGVALGVALTLLSGRLIASVLYGISPSNPVVLVAASAILLAVGCVAALLPAWRAARVDPITALRSD
jgi:predicted permease